MASHQDNKQAPPRRAIPEAPIPRSILIQPPSAGGGAPQELPSFSFSQPTLKRSPGTSPQSLSNKLATGAEHRWDVKDGSLECISPQFPLERNHVLIRDASPALVAERVARCLAGFNASVTYKSDEATAMAETTDGVKFQISLFRESADEPNGVLVECQRRRGDGFSFHKIARSVLRAAGGLTPKERNCPPSLKIPLSVIAGEGKRLRPSDPLP